MVLTNVQHLQIIHVEPENKVAEGGEFFLVNISHNGQNVRESVKVFDPFNPSEKADCRWYLERYATQEPFDAGKAELVAESIQRYASRLYGQLSLEGLFHQGGDATGAERTLVVDVCDSERNGCVHSHSLHGLHWELLEQSSLWSEYFDKITIRRRISVGLDNKSGLKTIELQSQDGHTSSINVLLVIARKTTLKPTAYQDVDPFMALNAFLAIQRVLEESCRGLRLNVEVVRPGTFEALRNHLESSTSKRGTAYYHLVHFDVHGRVATRIMQDGQKVPTAWLKFASKKSHSALNPVPADEVGNLLATHGIDCAVLNACDSARAEQGLHANLAMLFAQQGISNVLAMSYKFAGSMVTPFLVSFYENLFIRNTAFSQAASESRRILMNNPRRRARLGMEVDVNDWFIPVTYTVGQDLQVGQPCNAPFDSCAGSQALHASQSFTSQNTVVGRDNDVLRLERTLLESDVIFLHGPAGVGKSTLVKHAFLLWQKTNFFEECCFVDLIKENISDIQSQIKQNIKVADESQCQGDSYKPSNTVTIPHPRPGSSLIILDGLDFVFNKCFTQGLEPVQETISSILRSFTRDNSTEGEKTLVKFILVAIPEKDWWDERFSFLKGTFFPLTGLELPDALLLSESILQRKGLDLKNKTRKDTDFLVHIVNVLQRIPFALELALPGAVKSGSLVEDFYRELLVGEITVPYGATGKGLAGNVRLMLSFETIFDRFPEYQDQLCSLADFWGEGPIRLTDFFRRLAAHAGIHYTYNYDKLILCLSEVGGWKVSKDGDVDWIHPLLTLYLRQRRRRHAFRGAPIWAKGIMKATDFLFSVPRSLPYGSTPSLLVEIPQYFVRFVSVRDQANTLVNALFGFNGPDVCETMRRSLFNLFTAYDLCCRKDSPIPFSQWPCDLFVSYLAPSRLILSLPEQELLTRYVESITMIFLQNIGGFAVPPDSRLFALNLVIHLLTNSALGGVFDETRTAEFLTMANAMVDASEAQFGPFEGSDLMWKGMVFRFQAFDYLRKKDENAADEAWEKMKAVEIEFFGASIVNQQSSHTDSSGSHLGQGDVMVRAPKASFDIRKDGLEGRFQKALSSWVPIRHAAWPWIKGRVFRGDDTHAIDQIYLPTISNNFEDMVNTHDAIGLTGMDYWTRYFPPRNDMAAYIQKLEDPDGLLEQLEEGLDNGDWKMAAQGHLELFKKASTRRDAGKALFHLTGLISILKESGSQSLPVGQLEAVQKVIQISMRLEALGYPSGGVDGSEMVEAIQQAVVEDVPAALPAEDASEDDIRLLLAGAEVAREGHALVSALFQQVRVHEGSGTATAT